MWRALRAELDYLRSYLIVAWSIAAAVAVLVNVLTLVTAGDDYPGSVLAAGLPGIFFVIAAMIVGFIAQGLRSEERRARLLLAGPLTPRQLAAVTVLLPACLVGLGALAGGLMVGAACLITGKIEATPVEMVGGVAAQMFAIVQMGPLAQESAAARRQRREGCAIAGWTGFMVAILLLVATEMVQSTIPEIVGRVAVAATAMAASAALYAGRTEFTR